MHLKFLSAFAACLPVVLTGCLNSSGATTGASPGGATPPERLERGGFNVIHMEITDPQWYDPNNQSRTRRDEFVCPGVPPRGNVCDIDPADEDPTGAQALYDIQYLKELWLDSDTTVTWPGAASAFRADHAEDIRFFYNPSVSTNVGTRDGNALFGFGQYSGFLTNSIPSGRVVSQSFSAAFGQLHDGRPAYSGPNEPTGTATWRGAMIGTHIQLASKLVGTSEIVYSFADNMVDVNITNVRRDTTAGLTSLGAYEGPSSFSWDDLPVNSDASFYIPGYGNDRSGTTLHPTLGYIDGDFYGPNAEETAGVFERQGVSGAWLAIREVGVNNPPPPGPGVGSGDL